jgi:hypothetical protein
LYGDARETIKNLKGYRFNAVFHDPYSPAKNPELWSLDFFRELFEIMNDSGILTTYSSASQIRMALMDAGFYTGRGPSVGRKREGTIASKIKNINLLPQNEIDELKADIKSTPYRDYKLNDTREIILSRRIDMMKELREKKNNS